LYCPPQQELTPATHCRAAGRTRAIASSSRRFRVGHGQRGPLEWFTTLGSLVGSGILDRGGAEPWKRTPSNGSLRRSSQRM
jgi:hypothetical protein